MTESNFSVGDLSRRNHGAQRKVSDTRTDTDKGRR
jgi:hypothetical protein